MTTTTLNPWNDALGIVDGNMEAAAHMDKVHVVKEEPSEDREADDADSKKKEGYHYCNVPDILAKVDEKQRNTSETCTRSSAPERKERCPMCPAEFIYTEVNVSHMTAKHNAVFKIGKFHYPDPECSWTGKMILTYANHVTQHKAKQLECPHCPKVFSRRNELERHVSLHERTEEKAKRCPICLEVLFSLSGHMLMRHGIRQGPPRKTKWSGPPKAHRRSCPHCPKVLRGGGMGLKNHIRQRHKEVVGLQPKSEIGNAGNASSQDVNDSSTPGDGEPIQVRR